MALIRINAEHRRPVLHGTDAPLLPVLNRALDTSGPVTIMLHGYKFRPYDPGRCPHAHIFAPLDASSSKVVSWPKRLGYLSPKPDSGVGVAFGWNARGSLKQALRSAIRASHALAILVQQLRRQEPNRPVNLVAHSMGAYVALQALHRLSKGDIGRIILLNGAVFRPSAAAALRTDAGHGAELFNVVSGENAFYDILFEQLLGRSRAHDRSIGRGFDAPNALTIRLDDQPGLKRLAALGHVIDPPAHWLCHWSPYLRPGAMAFYANLLRNPTSLPLHTLQAQLTPRTYLGAVRPNLNSPTCSTA
ncbi:alpha/beta fold hydrolase [uncultured Shimia sp.]|uniref:alpha/beta fold hydrolase n=1 Tax=uncultured Shimia sp. TaxID=573152 RepID=UPI0025F99352|nr:alpha/beta fold hydrolase [uncultured Shimia sp.]